MAAESRQYDRRRPGAGSRCWRQRAEQRATGRAAWAATGRWPDADAELTSLTRRRVAGSTSSALRSPESPRRVSVRRKRASQGRPQPAVRRREPDRLAMAVTSPPRHAARRAAPRLQPAAPWASAAAHRRQPRQRVIAERIPRRPCARHSLVPAARAREAARARPWLRVIGVGASAADTLLPPRRDPRRSARIAEKRVK